MKTLITIYLILIITGISKAQSDGAYLKSGLYDFFTNFDETNFNTTLRIKEGNETIYQRIFEGRIDTLMEIDLDNNGEKEILINNFSGGAHCCNVLYAAKFYKENFTMLDSINWGNSFYKITDMYNNREYEFEGVNDMFAYAFTNYAQSQFNLLIYKFERSKFINVTKNFPALLYNDIGQHKETLKPYMTDTGFVCPRNVGDDTFNTDAGAVKAALAPIVADYFALDELNKGYEYVDSVYKCIDAGAFKDTLKVVFKLK